MENLAEISKINDIDYRLMQSQKCMEDIKTLEIQKNRYERLMSVIKRNPRDVTYNRKMQSVKLLLKKTNLNLSMKMLYVELTLQEIKNGALL